MYCRNCGNIVADDTLNCSACGSNPAEGGNYCPKCGHFCIPGDVECIQCKTSLVSSARLSTRIPEHNTASQQPQYAPPPLSPQQPQYAPPRQQSQPQSQTQQNNIETKIGPKFLPNDQRYCRNCGLVIPAQAQKCPFCDAADGRNYCLKCGSGTTSSDTVCSVCSSPLTIRPNVGYIPSQPPAAQHTTRQTNGNQYGQQQNQQYNNRHEQHPYNGGNGGDGSNGYSERHDWLVTLLLCIFLGYFGVHRFYTRNYLAGILQFFTGGGCGIWWLVDLIMILTDSYTDGNGNKLKRS